MVEPLNNRNLVACSQDGYAQAMLKHLLPGSLMLCACNTTCPPCGQSPADFAAHAAPVQPTQTPEAAPSGERAVASTPNDSPGAGTPSSAREKRTTEVIAAVVTRNRASVRRCYEQELAHRPGLRGMLTMRFTLDSKGKVTAATINPERSTIRLPSLTDCAAKALRDMAFPPSSRGFESTVNYPFNFKP